VTDDQEDEMGYDESIDPLQEAEAEQEAERLAHTPRTAYFDSAARRLRAWAQGEHRDSDVARDVRTLLDRFDELTGGYVIVTIAPSGIVHAYGDSDGAPFPTRGKALTKVGQMIEADAENYPNEEPCRVLPRKILGGEH